MSEKSKISGVEAMLEANGVEVSRCGLTEAEFNEEVLSCLEHNLNKAEIIENFKDLIEEANDTDDRYM